MPDQNESERYELPAELAALEKSLAGMMPVMPHIDRDRLMFEAGRASVTGQDGRGIYLAGPSWAGWKGFRFWPAATALATAASLMLAVALWRQTPSANGPNSVIAIQPAANPQAAELDDGIVDRVAAAPWSDLSNSGYLGLRNIVLTRGVGALPQEQFAGGREHRSKDAAPYAPTTSQDLLKEFLPEETSGTQPQS